MPSELNECAVILTQKAFFDAAVRSALDKLEGILTNRLRCNNGNSLVGINTGEVLPSANVS